MRPLPMFVLVGGLALAAGSASGADKPLRIELTGQNNSGESGYALLYPEGSSTRVEVHVQGGPAGVVQPDHIHAGTCAQLDPKPAYGLAPVTDGKSVTTVDVTLAHLLSTPMAINVHESAANLGRYVACGEIREPK